MRRLMSSLVTLEEELGEDTECKAWMPQILTVDICRLSSSWSSEDQDVVDSHEKCTNIFALEGVKTAAKCGSTGEELYISSDICTVGGSIRMKMEAKERISALQSSPPWSRMIYLSLASGEFLVSQVWWQLTGGPLERQTVPAR
jgi:hypothetical protein